jgi:hypothetical protein
MAEAQNEIDQMKQVVGPRSPLLGPAGESSPLVGSGMARSPGGAQPLAGAMQAAGGPGSDSLLSSSDGSVGNLSRRAPHFSALGGPGGLGGGGGMGGGLGGASGLRGTHGLGGNGLPGTTALGGGNPTMLTRMGGLVAEDVTSTVKPSQVGFLQTPSEGQLMAVPSESATALEPTEVRSAMLDAQMEGRPVKSAVSDLLASRGYTVYERAWGDFCGEFVRVAGQTIV